MALQAYIHIVGETQSTKDDPKSDTFDFSNFTPSNARDEGPPAAPANNFEEMKVTYTECDVAKIDDPSGTAISYIDDDFGF